MNRIRKFKKQQVSANSENLDSSLPLHEKQNKEVCAYKSIRLQLQQHVLTRGSENITKIRN